MLGTVQDSLLSLIFPQPCQVCSIHVERYSDGPACSTCWARTRFFDGSQMLCERCGAYLGEGAGAATVFCHRCDAHPYRKARALGIYEHALAAAIIALKSRPVLPARLRRLISNALKTSDLINSDVLVPIPLAVQRQKERGFNQAEVIANTIKARSGIPVDAHSLRRNVHTPLHRGGMDQKARELTVKKAFKVARPAFVEGKRILLVDDVLTSGSTAAACSQVLLNAGARQVDVFTIARAVYR